MYIILQVIKSPRNNIISSRKVPLQLSLIQTNQRLNECNFKHHYRFHEDLIGVFPLIFSEERCFSIAKVEIPFMEFYLLKLSFLGHLYTFHGI